MCIRDRSKEIKHVHVGRLQTLPIRIKVNRFYAVKLTACMAYLLPNLAKGSKNETVFLPTS